MHQVMLSDRRRIDAYDKAISQVVAPGAVVADVGAGMLPLTALALRHGAAHVYAIEADPQLVEIAAQIIAANGWQDRVTLVAGSAREVRLPEPADVLVAELMGNLGPEEDMSRVLRLMARRNLRPGGVVVPERLVSYLVPIEFDDEGWGVWRNGFLDMRLDVVREHVQSQAQLHFFSCPPRLLGEPVVLADSAAAPGFGRPRSELTLRVDRPGQLHAIAGYFEATLAAGTTLSNFPSYPGCNWAVWIWPLRHTPVAVHDEIAVRVRVPAGGRVVTDWRLDCRRSRKEER